MGTSSAEKVLTILKTISSNDHEVGNLELSQKSGFPRSTVNRMLHVLESSGFVYQNPDTKKYTLGRAAADIGRAVNHYISTHLVNVARPHVDRLRDLTGETAGFEVVSGKEAILLHEAKGPNPVSVTFSVGDRLPIHVAAGAKAILAFSPQGIIDRLIRGKLSRYTSKTITKPSAFKNQLREVRKQGVAFDYGELNLDVYAIGAPVFNHEKKPIAGVAVAAPAFRMNSEFEEKIIPLLKETAAKISAQIFYTEG